MKTQERVIIKSSRSIGLKMGIYLNGIYENGWPVFSNNGKPVEWDLPLAVFIATRVNELEEKHGWVRHNWKIEKL